MTTPNGSAVGAALAAIVQAGVGPSLAAHNAPAALGRPRAVFSTGVPFFDLDPLPAGSLVDVDGPSGVGKTAFLHHIAAHALAPPDAHSPSGVTEGTTSVGVAWIDLNGGLDLRALSRALTSMAPSGTNCETFVSGCLSRLHIFRPESSISLLCTLHYMQSFLDSPQGGRVRVLIVDALGVQHYIDAANRTGSGADDVEQALTSVMRNLLRETELTAFVSKTALFDAAPPTGPWPFDACLRPEIPDDFMPAAWRSLAFRSVALSRSSATRSAVALGKSQSSMNTKVPLYFVPFDITDKGLRFGELSIAALAPG